MVVTVNDLNRFLGRKDWTLEEFKRLFDGYPLGIEDCRYGTPVIHSIIYHLESHYKEQKNDYHRQEVFKCYRYLWINYRKLWNNVSYTTKYGETVLAKIVRDNRRRDPVLYNEATQWLIDNIIDFQKYFDRLPPVSVLRNPDPIDPKCFGEVYIRCKECNNHVLHDGENIDYNYHLRLPFKTECKLCNVDEPIIII